MSRYFTVHLAEDDSLGVAELVNEDIERFCPPYRGRIRNWNPVMMRLCDGGFPDYLSSDLGGRICSERLKTILSQGASSKDVLQWLEVSVKTGRTVKNYHILHFPRPPCVLNADKTVFAGDDFVVKAVLCAKAIEPHSVFCYPKNEGIALFVSENVKQAIEKARCTGIDFYKAPAC